MGGTDASDGGGGKGKTTDEVGSEDKGKSVGGTDASDADGGQGKTTDEVGGEDKGKSVGGTDAFDADGGKGKTEGEVGGEEKGKSKDPDFQSTDEDSTDDDDEKMEERRSSFSVATLEAALPGVKRSLSMVPGKAKSFQNFAELENATVQDLVKEEHPVNKRRRLLRKYREGFGAATDSGSVPEPLPGRREEEDEEEESEEKEKENGEDGN